MHMIVHEQEEIKVINAGYTVVNSSQLDPLQ